MAHNPQAWRRRDAAWTYVRRIRNHVKRHYAEAYVRHVFDGAPAPETGPLSVMGAQAVRMTVDDLAQQGG